MARGAMGAAKPWVMALRWVVALRCVVALMLAVLVTPLPSAAQTEDVDAGATVVRTIVERPPEGSLRRGTLPVPEWAVWAAAAVVILGAALGLGYRLGRSKR